jgi:hypothetical protein
VRGLKLRSRRRGVSEVVGALTLTFITLTFMSIVALQFTASSRELTAGYMEAIRRDRGSLAESLTLVSVDLSENATLWLYNAGRQPVEVVEVDINGERLQLLPPFVVEPGKLSLLRLNLSSLNLQGSPLLIRTSMGSVFRLEASP